MDGIGGKGDVGFVGAANVEAADGSDVGYIDRNVVGLDVGSFVGSGVGSHRI